LQGSEIFLPPDELLILRSKSSNKVISVHNNVNESIKKSEEAAVTTRGELNSKPDRHRHNSMMNNVQGRYVIIFLTEYKEEL
jgi:hypothetical protein